MQTVIHNAEVSQQATSELSLLGVALQTPSSAALASSTLEPPPFKGEHMQKPHCVSPTLNPTAPHVV
jgi:hypothetical protein